MIVLQLIGLASTGAMFREPTYVEDYDPNAFDGRGDLMVTDDPEAALRFPSHHEALLFYRQSALPPHHLRADGAPNRPLTAFSIQAIPLDRLREATA